MRLVKIGTVADFPDGKVVPLRIGARRIAVYSIEGELFAIKNTCPHEGDSLHRAPPDGTAAVCRSHGWRFDLRTGACLRGRRDARVAVYPVTVRGDEVFIDLDR